MKSKDAVKGLDNQENRRGWNNVYVETEDEFGSKFNFSAVIHVS